MSLKSYIRGFMKVAQSVTGYVDPNWGKWSPETDPVKLARNRLYVNSAARGTAHGLREVAPGLINFFTGLPAGLINGAGQFVGGGSFKDGFSQSWDFADKHYADPVRKALMAVGGNKVRDFLDSAVSEEKENLASAIDSRNPNMRSRDPETGNLFRPVDIPGTKDADEYNDYLSTADAIGTGFSAGSELAASIPAFGGAVKSLRLLSKLKPLLNAAGNAAGKGATVVAKGGKSIGDVASGTSNLFSKSKNSLKKIFDTATGDAALSAATGQDSYARTKRMADRHYSEQADAYRESLPGMMTPEDVSNDGYGSELPPGPFRWNAGQ